MNSMDHALARKRILVVEDDFFLADEICRGIDDAGGVIVGPASSIRGAFDLIASEPSIDAALLDANLGGEMVFPVADKLLAESVPFVFTSGYDDSVMSGRFPNVPICQKPTDFSVLTRALASVFLT